MNDICKKEHRYADILLTLPDSQSPSEGRHKCPGCAYELGFEDGFNNKPQKSVAELKLPDSQAGTGRHKSAQAAYDLGWKNGHDKLQTPY
jgi:hypothetical protein